ncbi:MAG: cob(I)yrinic acid a,c-diamide adenosyltransferase [Rhodothermales bacterium]|nr:cob(I)yrinic acid a,c-diamide adenosyltransferase [Rhodothermales bacterium]
MKIYTKTGDKGTTGLFGGGRVPKHHPRIEAYGTVDEINSFLGFSLSMIIDSEMPSEHRAWANVLLVEIQNSLFVVGAELATPDGAKPTIPRISQAAVARLEAAIDEMEVDLPPLKSFILPGGSGAASSLHVARTVCRRAERMVTKLREEIDIDIEELIPIYLNRLSDLLFVLARWVNYKGGQKEIEWHADL